jgi:co-chaperonin GroES (HSP10)
MLPFKSVNSYVFLKEEVQKESETLEIVKYEQSPIIIGDVVSTSQKRLENGDLINGEVKEGDKIVVQRGNCLTLTVDGELYYITLEEYILAKIES